MSFRFVGKVGVVYGSTFQVIRTISVCICGIEGQGSERRVASPRRVCSGTARVQINGCVINRTDCHIYRESLHAPCIPGYQMGRYLHVAETTGLGRYRSCCWCSAACFCPSRSHLQCQECAFFVSHSGLLHCVIILNPPSYVWVSQRFSYPCCNRG